MNNTQEQSNLLLRLPSYYSLLSEESIYLKACLSSPDASVFSPTACISAEHGAMESHRSSLTLWSTDHALFWFPLDLTVWVHRFPPPEAHLACWHEPRIGISRLSFSADGWQSCPNAAEVVIFSFQIVVSDLWPSFFFFFFLPLEAQTCQTVMCEPHSGVSFCQQPRHTHSGKWQKKMLQTNCWFVQPGVDFYTFQPKRTWNMNFLALLQRLCILYCVVKNRNVCSVFT